ncbi:MAG: 16S rRNA (adenine(1518)-N(6)/adenine(1519)-N(6))-dimethyltransferase RsmA [Wolbachia endosymbiont of Fragariocoptes setiger]|nr:16S rRNA (adenine(1518)-N(6)/adenine(1519)-N(6))-dimethyltransferase RsmA [Wolbachia endosymbiont of Fragariocoptes setiger]
MKHTLFKPKKSLGQNFILSDKTAEKIVSLAGSLENFNIIEIGPGYGVLTEQILKNNAKFLLAIEKDRDLVKQHDQLLNQYKGKYKVIETDALYIAEENLIELPAKIIASLPYNISVALLLKWLNDNIKIFDCLILVLQKEVAERLVAQPNSKKYGYLSVLSQLLCDVTIEFDLSPSEFFPRPKVYSSVIKINPLTEQRFPVNLKVLSKLMNIIFAQKRKMLRNCVMKDNKNILQKLQLSGEERAENLTIEQLCLLANHLTI